MADESGEEKTYDPSQKRIEQFRREGRVCQSKDVGSAAQLFMALVAFGMLGQDLIDAVIVELENCDFARFAPSQDAEEDMRDALDRAQRLLRRLDAVTPRGSV